MTFTVEQRNAGVAYVKTRIATLESKLSGLEKAFVPKFTDAELLKEVDTFLAAVTKV